MADGEIRPRLHEGLILFHGQHKGKVLSQCTVTPRAQTSSKNRQNDSERASGRNTDSTAGTREKEAFENDS